MLTSFPDHTGGKLELDAVPRTVVDTDPSTVSSSPGDSDLESSVDVATENMKKSSLGPRQSQAESHNEKPIFNIRKFPSLCCSLMREVTCLLCLPPFTC